MSETLLHILNGIQVSYAIIRDTRVVLALRRLQRPGAIAFNCIHFDRKCVLILSEFKSVVQQLILKRQSLL